MSRSTFALTAGERNFGDRQAGCCQETVTTLLDLYGGYLGKHFIKQMHRPILGVAASSLTDVIAFHAASAGTRGLPNTAIAEHTPMNCSAAPIPSAAVGHRPSNRKP